MLNMKAINQFWNTKKRDHLLFFSVLALGILARVWEFMKLPPSLNADEASIGVEAFSLLHYGIDRNGVSYPVHFIAWGNGQNALYGYLLIPFIALWGLRPVVIRLPMLISGVLSLPLVYFLGKRIYNGYFGLLSMFLLSISPWHILLSRWALESNIFPFVFLIGFICLLMTKRAGLWFVIACIIFSTCLYAYGTSYVMIPVFVLCSTVIIWRSKAINSKDMLIGIIAFVLVALPIVIFVGINTWNLNSVHLGLVTIPRFPIRARFGTFFSYNEIQSLAINTWNTLQLLITQSDGIIYNSFEPYGYFYKVTFPFALAGMILIILSRNRQNWMGRMLLLAWLGGSMLIGIFQSVNINRLNIIFIPLLICVAVFIFWLNNRYKYVIWFTVCAFLVGFIFFTIAYHGEAYRQQVDGKFFNGILPAIKFASQVTNDPICMTDKINMPYIFVMFSEQMSPEAYMNSVKYLDIQTSLTHVVYMGRYTFGKQNCPVSPTQTYLLIAGETPPKLSNIYRTKFFDNFVVYYRLRHQ